MKISLTMPRVLRFPKTPKVFFFAIVTVFLSLDVNAQLPVKLINGQIFKDDGTMGAFQPKKYVTLIDSLDKNLKLNPKDTTSLFYRATIHLFSNDVLSKPHQMEKGALESLVIAKAMAESAVALNMKDFRVKILRAQICRNLVYRYTADESWMFKSEQIAARRKQFNTYKELANRYYQELAVSDPNNAYDYKKLKVTTEYRL